jgi:hypothetical protein
VTLSSQQPSLQETGPSPGFGVAVKAYLLAQLRRIDEQLSHHRKHPHRSVHEVRKAVRRFRSVLALCDSAPGSFERIDRRVRRIGKALSALRDAHVLVDTASAVRRDDGRDAVWRALDALLARKRAAVLADVRAEDPDFAATRRRARRAVKALAAVDFAAITGPAVLEALDVSAAHATRIERKAKDSTRTIVRHRWRRQVRRLRLQLEGLEAIAQDADTAAETRAQARWILGDAIERMPSAATLAVLSERLGRQQDIDSLEAVVQRHDELPFRDLMLRALKRSGRVSRSVAAADKRGSLHVR